MESLLAGDPVRLGRYSVVGRVERATGPEWAGGEVRLLGRAAGGGRTVVLTVPAGGLAGDVECAARFRAEAVNSQAVRGSWLYAVTEVADSGVADEPVWHAGEYVPQLGLPGVLGVLGGPLPVGSVRAWGAALAEALAAVHGAGLVHGGVVPGNVRVTARGPSLAGFGAVRVASVEGTDRTALPGLNVRYLAPELLTGGRPRPASDVFALGAVLAYASTAHSPYEEVAEHADPPAEVARRISRGEAQLDAVPEGLRELIERCLRQDPAERPSAATVAELLRGDSPRDGDAGPERVVGDVSTQPTRLLTPNRPDGAIDDATEGPAEDADVESGADVPTLLVGAAAARAAGGPSETEGPVFGAELAHSTRWLPRRVWAEISRQTTRALLAEGTETDADRTDSVDAGAVRADADRTDVAGTAERADSPVPHGAPEGARPLGADAAATEATPPASTRRTTLVAALAGAVGVVAGGTALQLWRPLEGEPSGSTSSSGSTDNKAGGSDAKQPSGEPSGETGAPAASGKRLPPRPLWRRALPGDAMSGPVVCWDNRVLVVPTRYAVLGLDPRTGKQLWARRDVDSARDVVLTNGDQVAVLAPEDLVLLSPTDGAVLARVPAADLRDKKSDGNLSIVDVGLGDELWISSPSVMPTPTLHPGLDLQRFDLGKRRERWRVTVTDKGREVRDRHTARAYPDRKLVLAATQDRGEGRDHGSVRIAGLDQDSGERRWEREVRGISDEARVTLTSSPSLVLVSAKNKLVAYDPQRGRQLWSHTADSTPLLGHGTLAGDLVYVTDVGNTTHALDARSGDPRWSNGPGAKLAQVSYPPTTLVSRAGDLVLVTSAAEVDAFDAQEGSLRWRFADLDTTDADGAGEGRLHLLNDELVAVRVGTDLLVMPVR